MSNIFSQPQKFCRFIYKDKIYYGLVEGDSIFALNTEPWNNFQKSNNPIQKEKVKLLNPTNPRTIVGLIKSYKQSWEGKNPPKTVRWFIKPPNAAGIPGNDIVLPLSLDEVKVEVEMIIIIGKKIKNGNEIDAKEAIFGYTVGCDVMGNQSSFHRINNEPQDADENALGLGLKACDGFEPYGPFIYKKVDWQNKKTFLQITNGEGKNIINYEDNTSNLLYSPEKIVSDLSKVMTLSPGDIISSGTGKSFIAKVGDTVNLQIENLGGFSFKIEK
ncbi:fumarylacetoacetate hydrolase family protein [Melioribacteraceae bacterium 4301-Me]|uniref:fumarylacetoacetate hydrolase family protein n=1 Tax=Pyranulibacter aquaticus TaxID=3163344 RepID=UPI0035998139